MQEWHFPYRDQNKVLHEIIVQAETFDDALAEAVEELHAREDQQQ